MYSVSLPYKEVDDTYMGLVTNEARARKALVIQNGATVIVVIDHRYLKCCG